MCVCVCVHLRGCIANVQTAECCSQVSKKTIRQSDYLMYDTKVETDATKIMNRTLVSLVKVSVLVIHQLSERRVQILF